MAAAITRRGQSSSSSEETQDSHTSGVTIQHRVDADDAYFSEVGTGITRRGRSTYSSQETQDISHTSGVTIQHGVDVDEVQSSSENAKT